MNNTFNEQETYTVIEAPGFMVGDDKWVDTSWHNDVTASAELVINDELTLRVWVSDDDPMQREFPEFPKYMIEVDDENGSSVLDLPNGDVCISCETADVLEQHITELIERYK